MASPTFRKHLALWALRLMLAALFLFGGEVLVWTELQIPTPGEWLLRIVGYIALATLVLDLAVRYRIRDVYDSMALICIYAVLAGVLITPEISFSDFPRTMVTRVLGGHNMGGAVAFGLFLALTIRGAGKGQARKTYLRLVASMAWVGFYRGTWMRWTPEFNALAVQTVTPLLLFALSAGVVIVAILFLDIAISASPTIEPLDLRLPFIPFMLLIGLLLVLFLIRVLMLPFSGAMLLVSVVLPTICWSILWFRRSEKAALLMASHIPPKRPALLWIGLAALVFVATVLFAYALPLVGTADYNQLWLMEIGYGVVGFSWLPVLAGVIAVRGVDRQMRTREIDFI
jgi:hypothetical protein